MSYGYFGIYENLEVGATSVGLQREAKRTSVASAVHLATRQFGAYLNAAGDRQEFRDRLSYVLPELSDLIERTASFQDIPAVLKTLAWNFDKKDDDDDEDSKADSDSDSSDSDSDADSDDDSDSDDSDGGKPDFVDTDKDDDKDRKESRRKRAYGEDYGDEMGGQYNYDDFNGKSGPVGRDLGNDPRWRTHPDASSSTMPTDAMYDAWNAKNPDLAQWSQQQAERQRMGSRRTFAEEVADGFTGDLVPGDLEANPVDEDFEGDVNELQPAGFNAVGSIPGNPWGKQAAPQHLNPEPPAGPQWQNDDPVTQSVADGKGNSAMYDQDYGDMGLYSPAHGDGFVQGLDGMMNKGFDALNNSPSEGIKNELEKGFPETGAPGRHRAPAIAGKRILPFVPRLAAGQHFNPEPPGGPQWQDMKPGDSTWQKAPVPGGNLSLMDRTEQGYGAGGSAHLQDVDPNGFDEDGYDYYPQSTGRMPNVEDARAEVEKLAPQVGAPGRHRLEQEPAERPPVGDPSRHSALTGPFPRVARNANRPKG